MIESKNRTSPSWTVSWPERLRYHFDNWMSRGTGAIMGLLAVVTLAFVVVLAFLVDVLDAFPEGMDHGNFWDIAWGNLMRTLDPGTMGADAGWGFRILMLFVTIGGLVIVASLIGIVSGAFNDKMLQLRRGRSRVIETDHTLILGWNSQLFTIISELTLANASRKRSTIVVLADRDKVEMEDEIRAKVPDTGSTSVICRTGNPLAQLDLQLTSPQTARSIVVLPNEDDDYPDAAVIKTAMALAHQFTTGGGPAIVAELRDRSNLDAARLAGGERARWLLAGELISRMTVQTCLQRGLSIVCTELLDFAGDEIYFSEQPDLVGGSYLDAQLAFAESTVIGIARDGSICLNPPASELVLAGDELILIAADDSVIRTSDPGPVDEASVPHESHAQPLAERLLVLGYNSNLQWMLDDLANYVAPGSSVVVAASVVNPILTAPAGIDLEILHIDTTSRAALDRLGIDDYQHVLVLAYRDLLDVQAADAKTLVTLLHLRDIADSARLRPNIVSEMLDDRNRELAETTRPDDFIVSSRLVSLMLTQVSENPALITVLEYLFSGQGSEIYVRPAAAYIKAGTESDFYTVAVTAACRRETAIGFRIAADAHSSSLGYGVHLNPPKGKRHTLTARDSIIVLAESA